MLLLLLLEMVVVTFEGFKLAPVAAFCVHEYNVFVRFLGLLWWKLEGASSSLLRTFFCHLCIYPLYLLMCIHSSLLLFFE